MPNYSKECQPIAAKITGLETEITSFQKDLQTAAPGAKSFYAQQIEKLEAQVAQQRGLLSECVKEHPYKSPATPPKNPCLKVLGELNALQQKLSDEIEKALAPLQKDLQQAAGPAKEGFLRMIEITRDNLNKNSPFVKQIAAKQNEYDHCLTSHGGLLPLAATFKGKATLQTNNSHFNQPVHRDVTIGLRFGDWDHLDIEVTSFPDISKTFSLGIAGSNTETVTLTSGSGKFDPQSHDISFKLDLAFLGTNSFVGNSSLSVELTGDHPLTSDGELKVSGSSKFEGGALGGSEGHLEVSGTVSPHP